MCPIWYWCDIDILLLFSSLAVIWINTLRPRQNGPHFTDDLFKYIFLNENVWILIKISLKFVHKGPIDNMHIGSDKGMAANRRQAIIWTNDGLVYWRIYASLGLNELITSVLWFSMISMTLCNLHVMYPVSTLLCDKSECWELSDLRNFKHFLVIVVSIRSCGKPYFLLIQLLNRLSDSHIFKEIWVWFCFYFMFLIPFQVWFSSVLFLYFKKRTVRFDM